MGNAPSIPVAEIQETAKDVIARFTPVYVKQYGLAVVKGLKEAREQPTSQYLLSTPPTASEPLQMGVLIKQGELRKSWRDRYFVAFNASDNFEVRYYETLYKYKESPGKGMKGVLNLCWYRVERCVTDSDKSANGEFSVKIMPWWVTDRRRTWYIRVGDEETLKKWIDTFEYAASRAVAPLSKDPALRRAFEMAYRETRWNLDELSWFYFCRTESEQLSALVAERCERTVMRTLLAKIPSGAMESIIRRAVLSSLDQHVATAMVGGWKSVVNALDAAKPKLKAEAERNIGSILEKQAELKDKISAGLLGKVRAFVKTGATPVLLPVSNIFLPPLHLAWREIVTIFVGAVREAIAKSAAESNPEAAKKAWDDGLSQFDRQTYLWYGALYPAFKKVRDVTQYNPANESEAIKLDVSLDDIMRLLEGVELWQVERRFEEGMREMSRRAVFTLKKEVESSPDASKESMLAAVTAKLIHDCKLRTIDDMHWIFQEVLLGINRKYFLPTVKEELDSFKQYIPSSLESFVDVHEGMEDIAKEEVNSVIRTIIFPVVDAGLSALDALALGDAKVAPLLATAEAAAAVAAADAASVA